MKEIKPKVTAVLLNYKRPYYMDKVIAAIRKQKGIELEIILFDNNPQENVKYDVDVHIKSDKNFMCHPRFFFGVMNTSEYIYFQDDDLVLTETSVIASMIMNDRAYGLPDLVQGPHGKRLVNKETYTGQEVHIGNIFEDTFVDVIKGRSMFMRREYLETIPMRDTTTCDDIFINSFTNYKVVPQCIIDSFENLKEGNEGLSMSRPLSEWITIRNNCIKTHFTDTILVNDQMKG